jgi:hypothetical protein
MAGDRLGYSEYPKGGSSTNFGIETPPGNAELSEFIRIKLSISVHEVLE